MNSILGYLAQFSSFSRQGELLCTQGLAFLLKNQHYELAFRELLSAVADRPVSTRLDWRPEGRQLDGGRPDIEGRDAGNRVIVKVEAKLGAALGDGQLESYLSAMALEEVTGAVVLIVPQSRRGEIVGSIRREFALEGAAPWPIQRGITETRMAVVTWEEAFEALGAARSGEFTDNLNQLRAMYRVLNGDDLEPLTSNEEILQWRESASWWEILVERITRQLTPPEQKRVLTIGSEGGDHPYRRRYVCRRIAQKESCYSIGTRDPFQNHRTPIWLRFHKATGYFGEIAGRVQRSELWSEAVRSEGHLWFPLEVPLNSNLDTMIGALVEQVQRIVEVAYPSDVSE